MKKITKLMLSIMAVVCLLTGMGFTSFAQTEDIQILKLVVTEKGTPGKEKPTDSAKTLMEYEPGAKLAVVEEPNSTWYGVLYQGQVYYVKQADTIDAEDVAPVEEIDQELEEEYVEGKILIEEIVRQEEEAKKTRIWAAIIIVLIIAIFGVGILSHLKKSKEDEDEGASPKLEEGEEKK